MKRIVDITNYEVFYLDYIEGNLSGEETAALLDFLALHPDIKEELDEYEIIPIEKDNSIPFSFEHLKKEIHPGNVEEYIFNAIEKNLNVEDEKDLSAYLAESAEAGKMASRYQLTVLTKPSVDYPDFSHLKKTASLVSYLAPLMTSAAAIILFLYMYNPSQQRATVSSSVQASVYKSEKTTEKAFNDNQVNDKNEAVVNTVFPVYKKEQQKVLQSISSRKDTTVIKQPEDNKEMQQQVDNFALINDTLPLNQEMNEEKHQPRLVAENQTDKAEKLVQAEPVPIQKYIVQKFGQWVFGKKNLDTMDANEVFTAMIDKIDENTTSDLEYKFSKNKTRTSISLKIGSFEFYRSKSN